MGETTLKTRGIAARTAAWLTLALAGVGALAQNAPVAPDDAALEAQVPAAPVYEIELIVFAYPGGISGRSEDFAYEDTGRAAVQAERELLLGPSDDGLRLGDLVDDLLPSPVDITRAARGLEFTPIPREQWRLADTGAALERRDGYERLMHAAWRQPVYGPEEETTLDLARVALLPPELGGTASIYVTRFLHLKLDLALADFGAPVTAPETLVYRLTERRKMRSTELHFFDHPRFGALALITPWEAPEEGLEEDGAIAPELSGT